MSIGALFHTHICLDAVIGLEENQALLDKGIAELSLSGTPILVIELRYGLSVHIRYFTLDF